MYQSSWPAIVSLTAASGVTPILMSISSRCPLGESDVHWWKFGFRLSTICCLGT